MFVSDIQMEQMQPIKSFFVNSAFVVGAIMTQQF